MKLKDQVKCPKCNGCDIKEKLSNGGPAIYSQLVCNTCGFEGGTSRIYSGEKKRVEREIIERFCIDPKDAVKDFVSEITGLSL